jgi:hypothetical protein
VELVLRAGNAFRGAARSLEVIGQQLALAMPCPHWTTGRLWLLRLGHYELQRPKTRAEDWVWLVDHSTQIGAEKCLVVLGIRLSQWAQSSAPLRQEDLELIELLPVRESNGQVVYEQLSRCVEKTGVPREIVQDQGADLKAGVAKFCAEHAQTAQILDMAHQSACVLKKQLTKDPQWQAFSTQVGQTKFGVQQTELAFLVPPSQRSKARYMNLEKLIRWGEQSLAILEQKPAVVLKECSGQRLEEKLGWLREFRVALKQWSGMQKVIDVTNHFVRRQGLYCGAAKELEGQLEPVATEERSRQVAHELVRFVAEQSAAAAKGERLIGSTEVLESCFGKFKALERDQSKGGFTSLLLSFGAILTQRSQELIEQALEHSRTKNVREWCQKKLGRTVTSQRKSAYNAVSKRNKNRKKKTSCNP